MRRPGHWMQGRTFLFVALPGVLAGCLFSGPAPAVPAQGASEDLVRTGPAADDVDRVPGVPAGRGLSPSGPLRITEDGAVVADTDVHGPVLVDADHVTIRTSRVTTGAAHAIRLAPGRVGLNLVHVEVAGLPGCHVGIGFDHFVADRVDVHGCVDGVRAGDATSIVSSLIHDLREVAGGHNDGIQVAGGAGVLIEGNTVINPLGQTASVFVKSDSGPIRDVVIRDNVLDGGSYSLYVRKGAHALLDVLVSGNRFGRSAAYGPASVDVPVIWRDNEWMDGAGAIPG